MNDDELIQIYEAADELMALSIRDLLLEADLPVMLRPYGSPVMGFAGMLLPGGLLGLWGEVLVYRRDEERALELIGGFLGDLGMLEEAEQEP